MADEVMEPIGEEQQHEDPSRQLYVEENIDMLGSSGITEAYIALTQNYTKDNNSASYEIVLDSARQIMSALGEQVSAADFAVKYGNMLQRYTRLLGACGEYLESHRGFRWTSTGRGRVRSIRVMQENAHQELELLRSRSTRAAGSQEPLTWRNVMFGENRALFRDATERSPNLTAGSTIMTSETFRMMYTRSSQELGALDPDIVINMEFDPGPQSMPNFTVADRIFELLKRNEQYRGSDSPLSNTIVAGTFNSILVEIEASGADNALLSLLRNQIRNAQEMMVPLGQTSAEQRLTQSVQMAKYYHNQSSARTRMRDELLAEMGDVPLTFSGSNNEFTRVVNRMKVGDRDASRAILEHELRVHAWNLGKEGAARSAESYQTIFDGVRDELQYVGGFRLFDLSEGEVMARFAEIIAYDVAAMHTSDIGKLVHPDDPNRTIKTDALGPLTTDMQVCINEFLSGYRMMGRALWAIQALDEGWIPTLQDIGPDRKQVTVENGIMNIASYREFLQKKLLERGRTIVERRRKYSAELIAQIRALDQL